MEPVGKLNYKFSLKGSYKYTSDAEDGAVRAKMEWVMKFFMR